MTLPFPNIFSMLFPRWTCKIKPQYVGKKKIHFLCLTQSADNSRPAETELKAREVKPSYSPADFREGFDKKLLVIKSRQRGREGRRTVRVKNRGAELNSLWLCPALSFSPLPSPGAPHYRSSTRCTWPPSEGEGLSGWGLVGLVSLPLFFSVSHFCYCCLLVWNHHRFFFFSLTVIHFLSGIGNNLSVSRPNTCTHTCVFS